MVNLVQKIYEWFVGVIHAYSNAIPQENPFRDQVQNFCSLAFGDYSFVFAAFVMAFTFYIFLYLVGVITRNEKLKLMWKNELVEVIFLLVVIWLIPPIPCILSVDNKPLLVAGYDFFKSATINLYFSAWLANNIYALIEGVTVMNVNQRFLGAGSAYRPLQGFADAFTPMFSTIASFLGTSMIITGGFMYLYYFLIKAFVKYVLPIGFFLRMMPFTRRLGGGLIGAAVAVYLLFPLVFSFGYLLVKETSLVIYDDQGLHLTENGANVLRRMFLNIWNVAVLFGGGVVGFFTPTGFVRGLVYALRFLALGWRFIAFGAFVTFVMFLYLIFYAMAFLVINPAIRFLSAVFGQEITLANLTRLV